MTVVRVNPASVRQYGTAAETTFGEIRTELVNLVNHVTQVRYFGPNAVSFKTHSGQLASEFANKLNQDIAAISHAVKASTSLICSPTKAAECSCMNAAPMTFQPPSISPIRHASSTYTSW